MSPVVLATLQISITAAQGNEIRGECYLWGRWGQRPYAPHLLLFMEWIKAHNETEYLHLSNISKLGEEKK